jgi:molybdenum cofactor biosynthesis enzyme MoaA
MIAYDAANNSFTTDSAHDSIPNLMWHVTDKCPLRCPYCFALKTGLETPRHLIASRIERIAKLGTLKIDISGGEPLVYPWLPELCHAISQSELYQTLTTSGIGTNKNRDFVMSNLHLFTRILVSIDAPSAHEHDQLRGPGAFEAALSLIQHVRTLAPEKLRVNTVVTSSFSSNSWANKLANTLGDISEWCLIQPHPANKKERYPAFALDDGDFDQVVEEAQKSFRGNRLLIRRRKQYSSYWSLQPNGILCQHSDTDCDRIQFSIDSEDPSVLWRSPEVVATWLH